jgi:organic hydroperoxide reductase OsmC/OhrA
MSSHHAARIEWKRADRRFSYEEYSRTHRVSFGTGAAIDASAASEFRGDATKPNPEEMLVAALSSCHMLTFLAICARKGIAVDAYEDEATGVLERPAGGRMHVTVVTLRPKVTSASPIEPALLASIHAQAHEGCFIANSVRTDVRVEPRA